MTRKLKFIAALVACGIALPTIAQEQVRADEKPDSIVLETKVGSVMGSTGGEYVTLDQGKVLEEGQSLMLNDGAEATVAYYYYFDDGKRFRKCVEKYEGPNTYVIDDSCKKLAYLPSGSAAKAVAVIAGAALLGVAIGGGDDTPPGPISTGPNGRARQF
jgi:hypothetical protein